MPLSKEALKNLLDVMQKVSLAIAIVSLALFSSFLLSRRSIVTRAQGELPQLQEILKQIGNYDATWLIQSALIEQGFFDRAFSAKLISSVGTDVGAVRLIFPRIFYQIADAEWKRKLFKEIRNLDDVRRAWDTVASTECCVLEVPSSIYLGLPSLKKTVPLTTIETPPSNIARPPFYSVDLPVVELLSQRK